MSPTICLNMIVKNETKNLERLFKSLHKVIDYYVIHDTGSTDGTPEMIKNIMNNYDISGEIFHEEWVNFGVNRQKALESVINSKFPADYLFWIDADEELVFNDLSWFKNINKDCYNIKRIYSSIEYYNPHLISVKNNNSIGWHWKAPVHNFLSTKKYCVRTNVQKEDVHIISYCHGGAKSHNVTSKEKYLRDAKLLEEHLKTNKNDPRTIFYIAQSYKDAGIFEKAIFWYKKRLEVTGWIQEKYIACWTIGNLHMAIKKIPDAFFYYMKSYEYDDSRYEAFYEMIHYYRINGMRKLAFSLYKQLKPINKKDNKLFLSYDINEWMLDFEVSIIAFYVREYDEGIKSFKRLFNHKKIKLDHVQTILNNFKFYINHIKDEEKLELIMLRDNFEQFYFPKEEIKQIDLSNNQLFTDLFTSYDDEDTQGLKLTVTEKIN